MEWKYHFILSLMEDAWCFFLHILFFLQKLTTILELQHQTPNNKIVSSSLCIDYFKKNIVTAAQTKANTWSYREVGWS